MNQNLKVIDFSGYSFSGKSAYFDLVSEFDGYKSFNNAFEFELLRIPNGIVDLYTNLYLNWSPIRSSEAIRNFIRIIDLFSRNKTFMFRLFNIRHNYQNYFPNFNEVSERYIKDLIQLQWKSEWPFAHIQCASFNIFLKKLLFRLGKKDVYETEIYLSRFEEEKFLEITVKYLEELLLSSLSSRDKGILLNNAFETTNPVFSHKFFNNSKSIIVDRDPRDIYCSALNDGYAYNLNVGKSVIGKDVKDFVFRFRMYRNNLTSNENVLRTNFEDLVIINDNMNNSMTFIVFYDLLISFLN